MSTPEILLEAAEFIDHECDVIFSSNKNPRTETIEDPEMADEYERGRFLAEKLRQYALEG